MASERTEIRITGFGGQGVVLMGYIIGRAASINAGKQATMIQNFGPEARGSACSATLAIKDGEILYPYVREPRVLVAMSSEGYEKYRRELARDGTLIHEEDLVRPAPVEGQSVFAIPSTRLAESIGKRIVQNIVMLGFFTAVTSVVTREQMRTAVEESVPPGTQEFNLKAFDAGWDYFGRTYVRPEASPQVAVSL